MQETWNYLRRHYQIIAGETKGSTHVHVSLEKDYSLSNLQQVGLFSIHHEAAIEALLPENRHVAPTPDGCGGVEMGGIPNAESNWLASPFLAQQDKSRYASMVAVNAAPNIDAVVRLMNGAPDGREPPIARNYAWNFKSSLRGRRAIEFRKPPASLEAATSLQWAEFTMTFIQASVAGGDPVWATRYVTDISGLKAFLERRKTEMVNRPDLWQRLFLGKDLNANIAVEPSPCFPDGETSLSVQATLIRC